MGRGKWEGGNRKGEIGRGKSEGGSGKRTFAAHSWFISDFRLRIPTSFVGTGLLKVASDLNSLRLARLFFWLLAVSTFFTYALAVAWAEPLPIVFATNSLGVTLQLAAMIFFALLVIKAHKELHRQLGGWGFLLIKIAFACFALKVLMQAAVVVPYIATVAYTIRNFVIGFIHLMLLGVITQFILGYAALNKILSLRPLSTLGLGLLLIGFFGSELLLFLQGALFWGAMGFLPYYYEGLFGISLLMPVGVGVLLFSSKTKFPLGSSTLPPSKPTL